MNNVYGLEQKNMTETNVLHTLMTDCTTSETTLEKREQGGDMVDDNIANESEQKIESETNDSQTVMPGCTTTETTLEGREQGGDMVDLDIAKECGQKRGEHIRRKSEMDNSNNSNYTSTEATLEKREQGRDMVDLDVAKECGQKEGEHIMLRASTFGTVEPTDYHPSSKANSDMREQGRDMVDMIMDKELEQEKRLVKNIDIDNEVGRKKKKEKTEGDEEEDRKNGSHKTKDWKISQEKTTDGSPERVRRTSMRTRMGSPIDLKRMKPGMKTKVAKHPLAFSPSKVIDGMGLGNMKHLISKWDKRIYLEDTVLTFSKTIKPSLDPKPELTNGTEDKKTFEGK